MSIVQISDIEFQIVQKLLFKETGISLSDNKKTMLQSRLEKRLRFHNIDSFSNYLKIVQISEVEKIEFLNELTINETYFFSEMKHFEFLNKLASQSETLRVWSAASSIGAEAYSISMVLDSNIKNKNWEVIGTDINSQILDIAKTGLYQYSWIKRIPTKYQQRYCLKGNNMYKNKMFIDRELIKNVSFFENNLLEENLSLGQFDVIFLRNVLLYFTEETKIKVMQNVMKNLKTGGYLIISMTEHFEEEKMKNIKYLCDGIYQKV